MLSVFNVTLLYETRDRIVTDYAKCVLHRFALAFAQTTKQSTNGGKANMPSILWYWPLLRSANGNCRLNTYETVALVQGVFDILIATRDVSLMHNDNYAPCLSLAR